MVSLGSLYGYFQSFPSSICWTAILTYRKFCMFSLSAFRWKSLDDFSTSLRICNSKIHYADVISILIGLFLPICSAFILENVGSFQLIPESLTSRLIHSMRKNICSDYSVHSHIVCVNNSQGKFFPTDWRGHSRLKNDSDIIFWHIYVSSGYMLIC